MYDSTMNEENERVVESERHIIDLARIVAATQGQPTEDARMITITNNNVKAADWFECSECHSEFNEGDAQWNANGPPGSDGWAPECRNCLPGLIDRGEVILDRRSAHETLAYMLAGHEGVESYRRYFGVIVTDD